MRCERKMIQVNPLLPSSVYKRRSAKILIVDYEGIIKNFSMNVATMSR